MKIAKGNLILQVLSNISLFVKEFSAKKEASSTANTKEFPQFNSLKSKPLSIVNHLDVSLGLFIKSLFFMLY